MCATLCEIVSVVDLNAAHNLQGLLVSLLI